MLWSSPLYHGTISGSFKNALDWLQLLGDRKPAYLTDKVIGLISTAGGTQGLQAVNTMEFIVRALRGWAVPLVVPVPQAWRIIQQGEILDESVATQLRALGGEVARAAGRFAASHITTPEAEHAEATLQPVSDKEIRQATSS
jgi:FMN reductase